MSEARPYDIVILGATGFTGLFVLEEILRADYHRNAPIRVCAAARNERRLDDAVTQATVASSYEKTVFTEVVDVNDPKKLVNLARKTKVLLSCVGPYRTYGYQVALACVEGEAHYLDICGEPEFLETVQAKLGEDAKNKGIYMVGSCGFDSVPADVGAVYLNDNFPGKLNHIEMIAGHAHSEHKSVPIHATTLECAVMGFANKGKLRENRRLLMPTKLDLLPLKPPKRSMVWYDDVDKQWCLSNMGADKSVVTRTQHLLQHSDSQYQPIHFSAYFGMPSFMEAARAFFFGFIFFCMSATSWTQKLLISYPRLFTLGMFSWEGPDRADLVNQSFCMTLTGRGFSSDVHPDSSRPDLVKRCKVSGPDPGYYGTAILVTQCAVSLLREQDKLPKPAGVYTPGAAFRNSSLISRLASRGITFVIE